MTFFAMQPGGNTYKGDDMKFNAKAAEHEYITTQTSYRKLAEKYEVSYTAIREIAQKNEWVKKREEYNTELTQKLLKKSMDDDIDKLSRLKSTTDMVIKSAEMRAEELIQDGTNATELKQLASALKDLVNVQRDLHGILSKRDELSLRQETNNDGESGIVYIPPLAEDSITVVMDGDTDA